MGQKPSHGLCIAEQFLTGEKLLKLFKLFSDMIDKPFAPKFYKDLQTYYRNNSMKNEADAFDYLMRIRFHDNDSHGDTEQSEYNSKSN